jgi:aspartyl-tRNA(Asn)/glutamyl-tRNA(Gln) amidotransferase subunit A
MPLPPAAFAEEVRRGGISVVEHTSKILDEAEKTSKRYSHFALIARKEALAEAERLDREIKKGRAAGKLLGVPVSVKDCICVRGMESRASSRILSGYIPLSDAAAVERARKEGAVIIGKTLQDEFGFGTFGNNTGLGFGIPKNPHDRERSCGGSSAGSAGFTALTKHTHISLGESTGGSIACPSSFCGVAGITPTYGRVSRYGLIDYSNSMDKIGPMAKTIAGAAPLLDVVSGYDSRDSTSLKDVPERKAGTKKLRLGIPKELAGAADTEVGKAFWAFIKKAEAEGIEHDEISLPLNAKYGVAAYYLIAVSEASTNLARYCGMRYGKHEKLEGTFDEYFSKVRSLHFGKEAKRRIMLGTFARMSGFRDAYYLKAMKARTLLIEEYRKAFSRYDLIAHPTMPVTAPKLTEVEKLTPLQVYAMDLCTVPANLAGLPHANVNFSNINSMPCGLMLTAPHLEEAKLIAGAGLMEGLA